MRRAPVRCAAAEPASLHAFAQRHAGTVKDRAHVVGRQTELLADLVALETEPLAHHEDTPRLHRQAGQAAVERLHHLPALAGVLRLLPLGHRFAPMAGLVELSSQRGIVVARR
jgi:hypothetical protein